MPGASLALFADLGACHVQKSSVTICVLPAPSGWRATRVKTERALTHIGISIHALRVEGDLRNVIAFRPKLHFYPRPPGGGRPPTRMPARKVRQISIHALRVEGDFRGIGCRQTPTRHFYPRPPGGGRRRCARRRARGVYFYPRPPGGGRLDAHPVAPLTLIHFYPRPPGGGRHSTRYE